VRNLIFAASILAAAATASAQPPIRIILVGDSTVAPKNGWGPGFCADLTAQVTCINLAKNGRSSSSYRAEGSWAKVMDLLKSGSAYSDTYVLIQFGHNDQPGKPGRSTDLATEFPANLHGYVTDVKSTGAKPVLITPLTRRTFKNGQLKNDLGPWGDADKKVGGEENIPVLDLNTESAAAVQKMGPVEANLLAQAPPPAAVQNAAAQGDSPSLPKTTAAVEPNGDSAPVFDYTHLGSKGWTFFGRMVANELSAAVPALRPYITR
jgi:lysophospholipase L1-like esterase